MFDAKYATRIKLMKIWEILRQETDEDNPMPTSVLMKKLDEMGIHCDRRTIYADIKLLNDCGYEVLCNKSQKNEYYVVDRSFDLPELRILLDAVQAASFITERKTKEFVDKIADLAGSRRSEVIKQNIVAFNTTKNTNEAIYYSVNEIALAINAKKKVEFTYFDYDANHKKVYRKDGKVYTVNPFATIFSDDNYYLVCYDDKYLSVTHYRIDRMDKVKMLDEDVKPLPSDHALHDLKKHKKSVFGMYNGETEKVKFVIEKNLIDVVYDKFGKDLKLMSFGDDKYTFTAEVKVSPIFFGWCCAFGERLKVVAPDSVIERIKEHVKTITNMYE